MNITTLIKRLEEAKRNLPEGDNFIKAHEELRIAIDYLRQLKFAFTMLEF